MITTDENSILLSLWNTGMLCLSHIVSVVHLSEKIDHFSIIDAQQLTFYISTLACILITYV